MPDNGKAKAVYSTVRAVSEISVEPHAGPNRNSRCRSRFATAIACPCSCKDVKVVRVAPNSHYKLAQLGSLFGNDIYLFTL